MHLGDGPLHSPGKSYDVDSNRLATHLLASLGHRTASSGQRGRYPVNHEWCSYVDYTAKCHP